MSRRRTSLQPGAAPARVQKFLERNPDARPMEIAIALGIKRSTTEMAITRLVQMGLHERPKRVPLEAKPKQPALSPTESFKLNRAQFSAAAAAGPALTLNSDPRIHPTGTPFAVVDGVMRANSGAVQALGISGPRLSSAEHQSRGSAQLPRASYSWGVLPHGKGR